ncbi:MAG: selenocysteine-specific translation elongation factor [Clostridiaceae bacterium]|nr:selenocysteine-specific translation elongation factor [Clostridiaceae bacterium]
MNHVIIGTAGHVDHGKTCLIKALTGIDTDRLAEEKKRGITIELGFANISLPGGITAGIVDVPGHEKFIKNMLAGAGGIDIAMLIVAADEGVMPQTREHLSILSLLNIPKGVIVITKCDTVDEDWVEMVKEDVSENVKGTFLEGSPMVGVSAFTGQGLEDLKQVLADLASSVRGKDLERPFRLPADRVFTLGGFGTVITGTLIEGTLREGDEIMLYPSGMITRARSIQVHSHDVKEAYGGQRVAVNLAGIKKEDIERGEVAAAPNSMTPSMMADVYLTALKNSEREIKNNSRLHFYHGAREILAKVVLMDRESLLPGDSCYAQLRLEETVTAKRGDRFVVRFYSPLETVGGGEILDPCPFKHRRSDADVISGMEIKRLGDRQAIVLRLIGDHSHDWTPIADIARFGSFSLKEADESAKTLAAEEKAVAIGRDIYLDSEYVKRIRKSMLTILTAFHKANPLKAGIKREELRSRLLPNVRISSVDQLLDYFIEKSSIKEIKGLISISSFKAEAGEEIQKLMDKLEEQFFEAGFAPPATDDVIASSGDKRTSQVLEAMISAGSLVRLDTQIFISSEYYKKALEAAYALIEKNGQMTLGEFRDALGTSRKYAVALLEHFDKSRLTKKVGDARVRA